MAINYANLFANIGELIEGVNTLNGVYTDIDGIVSEVEASFQGTALDDKLGALYTYRDTWKSNILSAINNLKTLCTTVLTDRVTMLEELQLGDTSDVNTVLAELIARMVADSESIDVSTVTIGSVTTTKVNSNAGSLLTSAVLDGYNAPTYNGYANPSYNGVTSQISLTSDDMLIRCTTDSEQGAVTEGSEVWSWNGNPAQSDPFNWQSSGSGSGPSITTLNSYSYITNREFDDFTANVPDDWTIVLGTAGTHIDDDTSGMMLGTACLMLTGDGSLATIQLKQTMASYPKPKQRCCLAVWVKGTSGTLAGTLTIKFTGTGYTASSSEKIEMDATALSAATSWTLKHFFINLPAQIPDDFAIDISVTGTLTNAKIVRIDRMAFGPVVYNNGICAAVMAGSEPFLKGDKFTFTVTNDDTGAFQKFFRDAYKVQLPTSGSPTRADSLTTD